MSLWDQISLKGYQIPQNKPVLQATFKRMKKNERMNKIQVFLYQDHLLFLENHTPRAKITVDSELQFSVINNQENGIKTGIRLMKQSKKTDLYINEEAAIQKWISALINLKVAQFFPEGQALRKISSDSLPAQEEEDRILQNQEQNFNEQYDQKKSESKVDLNNIYAAPETLKVYLEHFGSINHLKHQQSHRKPLNLAPVPEEEELLQETNQQLTINQLIK